jgi:hypothetical protein
MTNSSSILPPSTAVFTINGYNLYVTVNQTFTGYYAYQKWATIALTYNSTPTTPTNTITRITTSANPSVYGTSVNFTATVSPAVPNGGIVTFTIGNTTYVEGIYGSVATLSTNALSVGTHKIFAEYLGSSNFTASTGTLTQVILTSTSTNIISSTNPSVYGTSVTFIATVSPAVPNGGIVTFSVYPNNPAYVEGVAEEATSGSVARFSIGALSAGTYSITASYMGSSNFTASVSSKLVQVVTKAPTKTSIATSANPSVYGTSVNFTATVSPAVPNGDKVTFYDAGKAIGTGTVSRSVAVFATKTLSTGTHSITATYSGDSNFTASASNAVLQLVNKVSTSTALTSSPNPATYGTSVTFTATVSPAVPNGDKVTFYDAGRAIGTGTVSRSAAVLSTKTLSTGTHSITATYSGDSDFAASTSRAVSQIINPACNPVRRVGTIGGSTICGT